MVDGLSILIGRCVTRLVERVNKQELVNVITQHQPTAGAIVSVDYRKVSSATHSHVQVCLSDFCS